MEKLKAALAELEEAVKRALGFTHTLEYQGIHFNVSQTLVVADLAPLAFVRLTERIGDDGEEAAVASLYGRLLPLLSCEHRWTEVKGSQEGPIGMLAVDAQRRGHSLYMCSDCTAYVRSSPETALPLIGRRVSSVMEVLSGGSSS